MEVPAEEVRRRMTHQPGTERTIARHNHVNDLLMAVAVEVNDLLPGGRQASLFLTAMEEARFRAHAAIALDTPEHDR
jgi:hypothetical protein